MVAPSPRVIVRLTVAIALIVATWGALSAPHAAQAFTYTVCPSGCPYSNVQDAINAAGPGDTIQILTGTYHGQFVVPYNLTFDGSGPGATILDGNLGGTVMTIYTGVNVLVSGITIQNGTGTNGNGGGVYNLGNLTLENSSVYSNTASSIGGGIYSSGALVIDNSTIVSNTSSSEGGGVFNSGAMTVTNSTLGGNRVLAPSCSGAQGGAIATNGTLSVANSVLSGNSAIGGSGCYSAGFSEGGAIFGGPLTITSSTLTNNTATGGAGNYGGNSDGGAIHATGNATLTASTVSDNVAMAGTSYYAIYDYAYGGGIYNAATMLISATTVSTNSVASAGGTGANAYLYGGGIASASGALTLVNSTLAGNAITGTTASGGGIYSQSTMALANSTLSGNSVSGSNSDTGGGFVATASNATTLQNTIVSKNIAPGGGPDCVGAIVSNGYNIVGNNNSCTGFGATGDQINVGAHTGPLQDNGGPTLTMALLPGSPAIDAGNPSGCLDAQGHPLTVDQRGYPRPDSVSGRCDIGAFEVEPSGFVPTPTATPSGTATATSTSTDTPTATATATDTPTPAATFTSTATSTPTPAPGLTVSPAKANPYQTLTITGTNFAPAEQVGVYWDVTSTAPLTTPTTTAAGSFTVHVAAPPSAYGSHTLIALGRTSGLTATAQLSIQPHLTLIPASGAVGSSVAATGVGFGVTEPISLTWNATTGIVLGTTTNAPMSSRESVCRRGSTMDRRQP